MSADATDKLLTERVRGGDEDAWQQLIDKYEGRLTAYVRKRLGNATTAEDVVQETFLGFLVSLPNYDDRTPLESFLFAIAAHKLTDVLRREGRRPVLPLAVRPDSEGHPLEPAGEARHASSLVRSREGKSVEEQVLAESLDELIRAWLADGELERLECIELLFVLGWANKDAARRLNISEQAVANHKHFVVSKLKQAVQRARLRGFQARDWGLEA
jgi:RNA polymerase sigma-70 factor (ECF subfamily)